MGIEPTASAWESYPLDRQQQTATPYSQQIQAVAVRLLLPLFSAYWRVLSPSAPMSVPLSHPPFRPFAIVITPFHICGRKTSFSP